MDLLFTIVVGGPGVAHPVMLAAASDARFGDVEPLLAEFIEGKARWKLNGRQLGAEEQLIEAGLCDGAILEACELGASEPGPGTASARGPLRDEPLGQLQVVGGPDSGTVWGLRPGSYVIGRSRSADLVLPSDTEVSRQHARLRVDGEGVYIEDLLSSNGTFVAGTKVTATTQVSPGQIIQLGDSKLRLSALAGPAATVVNGKDGARVFNRPPRIAVRRDPVRITVPTAPGERPNIAFSVAGAVLPLLIGGVMALLLKPIYILFALLSPVTLVSTYLSDRRKGSRSHRSAVAQFQKRRAAYANELEAAINNEAGALRTAFPGPAEVAAIAAGPLVRLWERRHEDADFLELRVGLADRPSTVELLESSRADGTASPKDTPPVLRGVPVTLGLAQAGVLGLCGSSDQVNDLARWLVLQIATSHAPDDVRFAVLAANDTARHWTWAMWLPHLRTEPGSRLAALALDDDAVGVLATSVSAIIDSRFQSRDASRLTGPADTEPALVVVLGSAHRMRAKPAVARILKLGPSVGVYSICLADNAPQLPEECRATAAVGRPGHPGVEVQLPDGSVTSDVVADRVSAASAEEAARGLAPLRLDRHRERAAGLPGALSLLDVLGLEPPTPEAIIQGWAPIGRTTAAVIGGTAAGTLVVDLQRDGPHGLVAGTTGSGKSELLQTLIASLAVSNRPDALNFVLVDYKGGSAFSVCEHLPHTVGMVTDLDGHLTERALVSLGAELRRRERLFRAAGVKDLEDYWRLVDRAQGTSPAAPVARVLIVIDEFASLAEELPGFVDGLVDLARRGRSLGIHLILATQRPAGVVSPAIKTNTNLRIAMRVTDAQDSLDVLDSPTAARISKSTPGRAYLRVGHDSLVEFQAARVGGRRLGLAASGARPILRVVTAEALVAPPPRVWAAVPEEEGTDLAALVAAVTTATESLGIARPPSPWLDSLPPSLALSSLAAPGAPPPGAPTLPFGLEDVPDEQARMVAAFDLRNGGHLFAAGDPGSGRSTLLRTVACSAATHASPADLHIYGIDCGNGALLALGALPHCGAVVSRSEVERTDRMIAALATDLKRRQTVLAAGGFSSLEDHRAATPPEGRLPYVLVLLDRWEGFMTAFEGVDGGRLVSAFQNLLREGPGLGLHVVLTGDRTVLIGRMATMAEQRLVLRLNDRSGYAMAGLNPKRLPEVVPAGRAFRADSGREIQIAMLADDPSGPAQVLALQNLVDRCRSLSADVPDTALPGPIAALPARVGLGPLLGADEGGRRPLCAAIGVGGNRLDRVEVDLMAHGPGYIVAGPRQSGRSNALVVLARALADRGNSVVGVVSPLPSPLASVAGQPGVLAVLNGRIASLDDLTVAIASAEGAVAVLVDDFDQLLDAPWAAALEGLLRAGRHNQRAVIIAGGTAELNAASYKGLVAEAKKSRSGLMLSPGAPTDADLLGVRLPKTALFNGPAGRAVQIESGSHRLIQIADAGPGLAF